MRGITSSQTKVTDLMNEEGINENYSNISWRREKNVAWLDITMKKLGDEEEKWVVHQQNEYNEDQEEVDK